LKLAEEFGIRAVHHTKGAREPRSGQCVAQVTARIRPPIGERARHAGVAEQPLPTVLAGGQNVLDVHRLIPVIRRCHSAAIGAKADGHPPVAVSGPAQFAEVEFALPTHAGGSGVADVRIVRPDDGLGVSTRIPKPLQRVEHVAVT